MNLIESVNKGLEQRYEPESPSKAEYLVFDGDKSIQHLLRDLKKRGIDVQRGSDEDLVNEIADLITDKGIRASEASDILKDIRTYLSKLLYKN